METDIIKPIRCRNTGVLQIKMLICLMLAILLAFSAGYCTGPPAYASAPGRGAVVYCNDSVSVHCGQGTGLSYDVIQRSLRNMDISEKYLKGRIGWANKRVLSDTTLNTNDAKDK